MMNFAPSRRRLFAGAFALSALSTLPLRAAEIDTGDLQPRHGGDPRRSRVEP
jgi:hypothetical protein